MLTLVSVVELGDQVEAGCVGVGLYQLPLPDQLEGVAGGPLEDGNRPSARLVVQRGGVEYVITAGWPTPNLTTTEADTVVDQLTQAGTHLVCLNAWRPGDGTPPAWWNDEEGAWMRQLDAMREEYRQQHSCASRSSVD